MSLIPDAVRGQHRPLVEMIYFDAGGGHRASATALKAVAEMQERAWRIRLTNLRDILEPGDFIRRLTGVRAEDFYNAMLKFDLTVAVGPMLPMMHLVIRRRHRQNVALLSRHWARVRPDLVVSLIPHFNRAIFEGLRTSDANHDGRPTPMVTIMTDLADYPPNFWIERQDQFLICGTSFAISQALATGLDPEKVLRSSGMIVRPEFYQKPPICRVSERQRMGLRPDLPTGLVMFGGYGSRRMISIGRQLAKGGHKLQLIFLCGHNQRLRKQLLAMKWPFRVHVEGFTREVPYFMHLADFFVGKPGPGSISEAMVVGIPVILERNANTMVQERFNTEWVRRNQLGVVIRSFSEIDTAIETMIQDDQRSRFNQRVAMVNNRAVFEIPQMLEELLVKWREPSRRLIHEPA